MDCFKCIECLDNTAYLVAAACLVAGYVIRFFERRYMKRKNENK